MSVDRFVDTNVLVYAFDLDVGPKKEKALELLESWSQEPETCAVSVQVLQELYVTLIRKGVDRSRAARIVRSLMDWPLINGTADLLKDALDLQEAWQLSFWDALILASARASGAKELISEDFNTGQNYGGIVARNPFVEPQAGGNA